MRPVDCVTHWFQRLVSAVTVAPPMLQTLNASDDFSGGMVVLMVTQDLE